MIADVYGYNKEMNIVNVVNILSVWPYRGKGGSALPFRSMFRSGFSGRNQGGIQGQLPKLVRMQRSL